MFSLLLFFVHLLFLTVFVSIKSKAPDPKAIKPKYRKIPKKVKKKVVAEDKSSYDHYKHLDRIEKRLEDLHEKVEKINDRQREILGQFEDHMVKHHRNEIDSLPPPPKFPITRSPTPSLTKESRPGPHPEALHPEGPPENMSLGDDSGELGPRTGPEPLKTNPPKPTKKCPRCKGDVKTDWVKCPACGEKL